jgi:hypothetical protein
MATTSSGIRCCFDALEPRRLMSSANLDGDVLVVEDDALANAVYIRQQPGTNPTVYAVEIKPADGSDRPPQHWEFPLGKVKSVVVRGRGGNDVIDLAVNKTYTMPAGGSIAVGVPTRIDAGPGDDVVYGGASRDLIVGGWGNDIIDGGDGNDWIDGGRGDDMLHGRGGSDFVHGNAGNDAVSGDAANDRLYGGSGNDFLGSPVNEVVSTAEPGNDLLVGGFGEDRLLGGDGIDRAVGGPGRDHFSADDDVSDMPDRTPDEPIDISAATMPTSVLNMENINGVWKSANWLNLRPATNHMAGIRFWVPEITYGSVVTVKFQRRANYPWEGNLKPFRVWFKRDASGYPNFYAGRQAADAEGSTILYTEKLPAVTGRTRFYFRYPPPTGEWREEIWHWKVNSDVGKADGAIEIKVGGVTILSKTGWQTDDADNRGVPRLISIQEHDSDSPYLPRGSWMEIKDVQITVS